MLFRTFANMKKLIAVVFILSTIVACREKKQIDVQPPVFASVTVDGSSLTTIEAVAGETLHILANVTDNTDLNQVQISLHAAEDGHAHGGSGHQGGEGRLNVGTWAFSQIVNISGTSSQQQWDLQVPDSIGGNWHIFLSLLDDVGLVGNTYTVLVHVNNQNLPEVTGSTIPMTDENGTVHVSVGNNLQVMGETNDLQGIKRFFAYMRNSDGVTGDTLNINIVGEGYSMAFGPANFNQPHEGTFRIVIEAMDSLGYRGKWDAKVIVD